MEPDCFFRPAEDGVNEAFVLQEGQRFSSQVDPLFVRILASNFFTMDRGKSGIPHWTHLER